MKYEDKRVFAEVPDDINENWRHGTLIGGMAGLYWMNIRIANAYKFAGDLLIGQMLGNLDDIDEVIYPALFNYRHAIEIYLKSCLLASSKGHNIKKLVVELQNELKSNGLSDIPEEIRSVCLDFHEYDERSTAFRYDDNPVQSNINKDIGEFWVDFIVLKRKIELAQRFFSELEEKRKGFGAYI